MKPVWEREFEDPACTAFGAPSSEVLALIPRLPVEARVLDLGCGAGRNAIPLARAGCEVVAIDRSEAGITRLLADAQRDGLAIEAHVADLAEFEPHGSFDLVVAHGVLHLLDPAVARSVASRMKVETRPGGWNVVAVFTNRLPQPPDLAPFVLCVFEPGQLSQSYSGWELEMDESYVFDDQHIGGVRHRHAVEKVVARRPGGRTG